MFVNPLFCMCMSHACNTSIQCCLLELEHFYLHKKCKDKGPTNAHQNSVAFQKKEEKVKTFV